MIEPGTSQAIRPTPFEKTVTGAMKAVVATLGRQQHLKASSTRRQAISDPGGLELDRRGRWHPRIIKGLQDQGRREWLRCRQKTRQW